MRATSFRGAQQAGLAESPGSVVWFISFGDLLTLLLCFFLVLTPWGQLTGNPVAEKLQAVAPQGPLQERSGTSLAEQSARKEPELLAEIPLRTDLVSSQDGIVEAKLLLALEDVLLPHLRAAGISIKVTVCGTQGASAETLERVLPLVASKQFSHIPLEVEVGAGCAGSEVGESSQPVAVGRVNISRM